MVENAEAHERDLRSMPPLSEESAIRITVEYLKRRKNTDKVDVVLTEEQGDCWVVHGTCPIEFGGTQWPEKFSVTVDSKGKIKSDEYGLL